VLSLRELDDNYDVFIYLLVLGEGAGARLFGVRYYSIRINDVLRWTQSLTSVLRPLWEALCDTLMCFSFFAY
jgi:hypothetical protein